MATHVLRITDSQLFQALRLQAEKEGRRIGKQTELLLKQALGLS